MNSPIVLCFLLLTFSMTTFALENGLAKTPPMGWLAWERFRCNVDCKKYPDTCLSEKLIKEIADVFSNEEWIGAGYQYLNIDDCWQEKNRTKDGELVADFERFPSGIKSLADYVHSKGLKLGIYNDMGTQTCGGYPGECKDENCTLPGYMAIDAKSYASWGIDSLKMDGCNSIHTPEILNTGYVFLGDQLNKTGRPIMYSCSWPDYIRLANYPMNLSTLVAPKCNIWRMYDDIQDSWDSVTNIIDWVGDNQDQLIQAAGPGHYNDPDMLIIGNFGLSYEQSKTQMAMWSIMAAPLLMGNDPRNLAPELKDILLASEVIAIDQDKLGKQGKRVIHDTDASTAHDIWVRELEDGDYAIAVWNRNIWGSPEWNPIDINFADLGIDPKAQWSVRDTFAEKDMGIVINGSIPSLIVNIDSTMLLRLTQIKK